MNRRTIILLSACLLTVTSSFLQRASAQTNKRNQAANGRNQNFRNQNSPRNGVRNNAKKPPVKAPPKSRLPEHEKPPAKIDIAPVDTNRTAAMLAAAAKIDSLVEANYTKHNITPNPVAPDDAFVRRVYLDITGTIPSGRQAFSFLALRDAEKRTRLIDHLLNSPGYASHFYNYWGDILRLVDKPNNNVMSQPYNEWVKLSIRKNKPYDQWVREMLTAEGRVWDTPATGYLMRDAGMPLDNLNNTVQVFLGTRIGCAQCHNHPFDRWKQKEFYELAAFMNEANSQNPFGRDMRQMLGDTEKKVRVEITDRKVRGRVQRLLRLNRTGVKSDKPPLKFPHDYSYSDAKPNQRVSPAVPFGPTPTIADGSRRAAFAGWMTSKENPRFALTIANRLWKRAMGRGLIEPVDDLRDDSVATNPALLEFLAAEMIRLDFNLKEFQRIIYNTKTYQRAATMTDVDAGEDYHFPGPLLRRMSAEQAWDSLLTLTLKYPDSFQKPSFMGMVKYVSVESMGSKTLPALIKQSESFDDKFGVRAMRMEAREFAYKGTPLGRASELEHPLPANHFIRKFGQGDRELIEGADKDGTVPQVLTMFNGPVTHMMLERGSFIFNEVVAAKSETARIDVIFLSMLSRRPTAAERLVALKEIRTQGAVGYGDVIWALLNTREFLFIQ